MLVNASNEANCEPLLLSDSPLRPLMWTGPRKRITLMLLATTRTGKSLVSHWSKLSILSSHWSTMSKLKTIFSLVNTVNTIFSLVNNVKHYSHWLQAVQVVQPPGRGLLPHQWQPPQLQGIDMWIWCSNSSDHVDTRVADQYLNSTQYQN